jgi:chromosome segregation ATPase
MPDLSEAAKWGGSAGAGGVLAMVLGRLFSGNDKVLERLEQLHNELADVKTQLAVLINANDNRDSAIKALQAAVDGHQRSISALELAIVKIEAKLP